MRGGRGIDDGVVHRDDQIAARFAEQVPASNQRAGGQLETLMKRVLRGRDPAVGGGPSGYLEGDGARDIEVEEVILAGGNDTSPKQGVAALPLVEGGA